MSSKFPAAGPETSLRESLAGTDHNSLVCSSLAARYGCGQQPSNRSDTERLLDREGVSGMAACIPCP